MSHSDEEKLQHLIRGRHKLVEEYAFLLRHGLIETNVANYELDLILDIIEDYRFRVDKQNQERLLSNTRESETELPF